MRNEQIRLLIKESGFKMWEVAEKLNISDGNFSRKLRKELSPQEKEKIHSIIIELKKGEQVMNIDAPRMMTIREIAKTGLLTEHALRMMLKGEKLPAIFIGKKALINYDLLCEYLSSLEIRVK